MTAIRTAWDLMIAREQAKADKGEPRVIYTAQGPYRIPPRKEAVDTTLAKIEEITPSSSTV